MVLADGDVRLMDTGKPLSDNRLRKQAGLGGLMISPTRDGWGSDVQKLLGTLEGVMADDNGGRVMLFTSASAGEGKTTVVSLMARYLVRTEQSKVIVIDASASHSLAGRLGAPEMDLRELLATLSANPAAVEAAAKSTGIIVARPNAVQLNDAAAMLNPVAQNLLRTVFDYILIEFPAFTDWPGVVAKSMVLGGLVLVVEAGQTRWPVIQQMRDEFEAAGGKVLGVILNKRRYKIPKWIDKWL